MLNLEKEEDELTGNENDSTEILSFFQNIPVDEDIKTEDIEDWMKQDDREFEYTDKELVELISNTENLPTDDSDDENQATESEPISYTKVFEVFEIALQFVE